MIFMIYVYYFPPWWGRGHDSLISLLRTAADSYLNALFATHNYDVIWLWLGLSRLVELVD